MIASYVASYFEVCLDTKSRPAIVFGGRQFHYKIARLCVEHDDLTKPNPTGVRLARRERPKDLFTSHAKHQPPPIFRDLLHLTVGFSVAPTY